MNDELKLKPELSALLSKLQHSKSDFYAMGAAKLEPYCGGLLGTHTCLSCAKAVFSISVFHPLKTEKEPDPKPVLRINLEACHAGVVVEQIPGLADLWMCSGVTDK